MAKKNANPKPKPDVQNFWLVTHMLQDQIIRTVVVADGYGHCIEKIGDDNILTFFKNEDPVAVFKQWVILEKISQQEAKFLQESQLTKEEDESPKTTLNKLMDRIR